MAIPLAWLAAEGLKAGFRPWEKLILAAGFLLPALSRTLAATLLLPLGPVVIAAIFALVLRRWLSPSGAAQGDSKADNLIEPVHVSPIGHTQRGGWLAHRLHRPVVRAGGGPAKS